MSMRTSRMRGWNFGTRNTYVTMTSFRDTYARYCGLLTLAEQHFAYGDLVSATRLAQIAARYAFPATAGLLGSPRLERLLLSLGARLPLIVEKTRTDPDARRRRVLHILSYARQTGGDTRYVWRWMKEDSESQHSVAVTTQEELENPDEIPDVLVRSAEAGGGFFHVLKAPTSDPIGQALELRSLCQRNDVVVLHIYPYDVIPILALAAGCKASKVLFVNHSDHTFWIGASVAHLVVHLRTQSDQFLSSRRHLVPERSTILPIPLNYRAPQLSRGEARRVLGLTPEELLLLTIASPFKYSSPDRTGLLELAMPVIAARPEARLIAVGPEDDGDWRAARKLTQGRVVALGRQWNNDVLYAAADVYLDSVPFSSITSLLEAGGHAIPLLGYSSRDPELILLEAGAPGLDGAMELGGDVDEYRALLTRLITRSDFRRERGERTKAQILALHTNTGWVSALEDAFASLERVADRNCLSSDHDSFNPDSLDAALTHLYMQVQGPLRARRLIVHYIGSLPYGSRVTITRRLHGMGFGFCWLNIAPEGVGRLVRRVGSYVKHSLQRTRALMTSDYVAWRTSRRSGRHSRGLAEGWRR